MSNKIQKNISVPAAPGTARNASSAEHVRLLLENSQDILVETTIEGGITYVSPNLKRVLGLNPEEVIGTSIFTRMHPADAPAAMAQLGLAECWTTCRYLHKDGSWRWLETTGRDFELPDGTRRSALIVRDVTQHKQTQNALDENERVLGTLLSNLPGMVYRARNSSDWQMDFVSDGCREITGYAPHDLTRGRIRYGDLIDEADRERVWDVVQNSLQSRRSFELQYRIHTASGEVRWVWERGLGVFSKEGKFRSIEGFIMDITEAKKTEQALRESEEKFSKAFRASPGALSIMDVESCRFIEVNDGYLRMFGHSREEFLSNSPVHLGLFENADEPRRVFNLFSAQGFIRNMEIIGRSKDGNRIVCLLNAEPVQLNGRTCVVTTLNDVTELRQIQEERASLEAQLRQAQKMEMIGALASGIAHDFNNILAGIMAYTDLARMETSLSREVHGYLAQVHTCCGRAKNLVQQILTFSRRQKQERAPMRLNSVFREALNLIRSTLPSTIEIESNIAVDAPAVLADPTQIHQIIINLCTNAAHAMQGVSGKLRLELKRCRVDAHLAESISDLKLGDYAQLTVSDTGHGMDAETLDRIFEPFFTTKAPGQGTGLGLSVVQGIVREHGGAIAVKSRLAGGSTFDIYIPALPMQVEEASGSHAPLPRGNGEQILFVEDEPLVRASMSMILSHLGYRIVPHETPTDALEHLRECPGKFDLVITDLTMPRMTGIELALCAFELRPGIPIILTSGFSGEVCIKQIRSLGFHSLLIKPISVQTLAHEVRTVLDRNQNVESHSE